jgi:hypothetical protein
MAVATVEPWDDEIPRVGGSRDVQRERRRRTFDGFRPAFEKLDGFHRAVAEDCASGKTTREMADARETTVHRVNVYVQTTLTQLRSHAGGEQHRSRVIAPKQLLRLLRDEDDGLGYPDVERPRERGDCASVSRPCPFISCTKHLYQDTNEATGAVKFNFPHLQPWEMPADRSCSLDIADRGGVTLDEVGDAYNLTRERVRQVEVRGLEKIRRADPSLSLPTPRETYAVHRGPYSGAE